MSGPLWRLELRVPDAAREEAESLLEAATGGRALALSSFAEPPARPVRWAIEALLAQLPDSRTEDRIRDWCRRHTADLILTAVEAGDWVVRSQALNPAVRVGRYLVAGSHLGTIAADGARVLQIDASNAFGTGSHGSTRGCLAALDYLSRFVSPDRVLDLGCGSGVLAMAAAKTWPRPVWASDIDREAVAIARDNARRNGLGRRIRLATGPGLHAAALRAASPFDLVLANILARPLIGLAPILRCRVAADGWLVLSGLLIEQTAWVEAAYRRQGFVPARRFTFEDWRTLVLGRRSRKKQSAGPRAGARWRSPDGART